MDDDVPDGGIEAPNLDADFVKAAKRRELTARERAEAAERARATRERLAWQRRTERRRRRLYRRSLHWLRGRDPKAVVVLIALVVLGVWATVLRSPVDHTSWRSGNPFVRRVEIGRPRPPPTPPASKTPLRPGEATLTPNTSFRFMAFQPESRDPVTYDPCRPIPVVVNTRSMPPNLRGVVAESLETMSRVSGFDLRLEGTTGEKPSLRRDEFQPKRYGQRWAPVLVAWSDPKESPQLEGPVAGSGGSSTITLEDGRFVYVTGTVLLDGPQLGEIVERDGIHAARAIVLHELGHLLGLAHVRDATQLMHEAGHPGITSFGAGDLSGLAQLRTAARCVPAL